MKMPVAIVGSSIAFIAVAGIGRGFSDPSSSAIGSLTPALFDGNLQKLVAASISRNKPIIIPCGTYDDLQALQVTVPDRRSFVMRGESRECVVLDFRGSGLTATFAGIYSAIDIEDITFATADMGGRFTALQVRQSFINPNPALSATSQIARVTFRGAVAAAAPFPFWANGFVDTGVSNINLDNVTFEGNGARRGNGLLIQGYKPDRVHLARDGYAVSINITNFISFGCDASIVRGDLVQGLTVSNGQATGCHYGVAIPGDTIGENDQVHIKGGQWADDLYGVSCVDPHTAHMVVEGGYYITVGTAVGIQSCGEIPIVAHNTIGGNASPESVGIDIAAPSPGNNALIEANSIRGVGVGIKEEASITSPIMLVNNQISDTTIDYAIDPSDRLTMIVDQKPRSLSSLQATVPCGIPIFGSKFVVSDAKKPTFMGPIVEGGDLFVQAMCDSSLKNYVAY